MIYSRIVKFKKTFADGKIQEIFPNIKVLFYKVKSKLQYEEERQNGIVKIKDKYRFL